MQDFITQHAKEIFSAIGGFLAGTTLTYSWNKIKIRTGNNNVRQDRSTVSGNQTGITNNIGNRREK